MLALVLTALAQAPPAGQPPEEIWVTLSRKQGVAAKAADEQVAAVIAQLAAAGLPVRRQAGDLSKCQKKLKCIVAAARREKATFVAAVETARVLDGAIIKVSLISVEEDGRTVATALYDGPAGKARAELEEQLKARLVPALTASFPPPAPEPRPSDAPIIPAPPPEPPPMVATVVQVPTVADVAPKRPAPMRTVGVVVGSVGAAGLIGSGVLGALTLSSVAARDRACPPDRQCNDAHAFALDQQAQGTQRLGIIAAIAGGTLLATGAVLYVLGAPPAAAPVAVVPLQGGALLSVRGTF